MVIATMTCVSTSNISVNNAHLAIALMTHTINIADIAIKRVLLTTESTTDSLDGGALELRESLVSLPVYTTMQTALYHPYQEKEGENEKQIVVNNAQGGWKHRRNSEKRRRAHANKHFHINTLTTRMRGSQTPEDTNSSLLTCALTAHRLETYRTLQ
jgi:hypothetical protein